jgi:hypothetical protein
LSTLKTLNSKWLGLIKKSRSDKWEKFGKAAAESMQFYASDDQSFQFSKDYVSSGGLKVNTENGSADSGLTFEATANLVANVVSVFLPVLYHRNPVRTISPRKPNVSPALLDQYRQIQAMKAINAAGLDPAVAAAAQEGVAMAMQMQAQQSAETEVEDRVRAALIEWYLNYTPRETDLKSRARDAIIEAIVKGMGLLWAVVDESDERRVTGLEYDSVDHLFIDPDAEKWEQAKWIARRRRRPVWEVERDFGLEPGSLKATDATTEAEVEESLSDDFDRKFEAEQGESNDLCVYYEVYSRMGIGARIKGAKGDELPEDIAEVLEGYGDFAYLVVSPTHDVPLNLPEEVLDSPDPLGAAEEIKQRLAWPAAFYKNRKNPWPVAPLMFRKTPRQVWPQSYIRPAMGYQKCINWIFSFLMGRIKLVSRAFMVVPKGIEEEIKDAILSGKDLTLLEINSAHPGTMDQLIQFIKLPEENANIWNLLASLKKEFEDATGVTELNMSGRTSTQMRSAAEADLKRDVLSVRPDDMANEVDNWMGNAAFIEAIAARSLLTAEDVAPVFGEETVDAMVQPGMPEMPPQMGEYTRMWVELVQTDDVDRIVSEYEYSVEAGSARKPNKQQEAQNIDEGSQLILQQFLQIWQTTGDPSKFNTWIEMWAKSRDFADYQAMMLPDMSGFIQQQQAAAMGPQGMPPEQGGPDPSQQGQEAPPPEQQGPPQ